MQEGDFCAHISILHYAYGSLELEFWVSPYETFGFLYAEIY